MALQKAELERMLRRGGANPWETEYKEDMVGRDLSDPTERMKEPLSLSEGTKSFSFWKVKSVMDIFQVLRGLRDIIKQTSI